MYETLVRGGRSSNVLQLSTVTRPFLAAGRRHATPEQLLKRSQRPKAAEEALDQSTDHTTPHTCTEKAVSKLDARTMEQVPAWSMQSFNLFSMPTRQPGESINRSSRPKIFGTPSQAKDRNFQAV